MLTCIDNNNVGVVIYVWVAAQQRDRHRPSETLYRLLHCGVNSGAGGRSESAVTTVSSMGKVPAPAIGCPSKVRGILPANQWAWWLTSKGPVPGCHCRKRQSVTRVVCWGPWRGNGALSGFTLQAHWHCSASSVAGCDQSRRWQDRVRCNDVRNGITLPITPWNLGSRYH